MKLDANSKPLAPKKITSKDHARDRLKNVNKEWINHVASKNKNSIPSFFEITHHKENLFSDRFNFLVLSYSLFVTAFVSIESRKGQIIILGIAFVVILLLSLSVYRAYLRFDTIMKMVYKIDPEHNPYSLIQEELSCKGKAKKQTNWIMGWGVSLVLLSSIVLAFIMIVINIG